MPTIFQIGATSGTGVTLTDSTRYRIAATGFRGTAEIDEVFTPMIGGNPVLSRRHITHKTWEWLVRCVRAAGHQERLTDFDAVTTQLENAIDYSLGDSGTPIYLWEQYGNQSAVRQYLVVSGDFIEEERIGGGAGLHIMGRLRLKTRTEGV